MRGLSVFISSAVLTAAVALAQAPDYFPLDVGNVWIYRTRQSTVTVEVTQATIFRGVVYYLLSGYRSEAFWVRNDGAGRVFQYDEKTREEKLWYDFSRKAGEGYETSLPTCCGRAWIENTALTKRVALGTFENVFFQVSYPGVFQVGITEEDFLPYVGLVYRSENTGGPSFRTEDLTYARLSGVTVVNASGIGFGMAVRDGYVRLFMNNNTNEPIRFVLTNGLTYDVILRDAADQEVYRWTRGKAAPQGSGFLVVPPGETSWLVEFPEMPGAMTVTGELLVSGQRFSATAPLRPSSRPKP